MVLHPTWFLFSGWVPPMASICASGHGGTPLPCQNWPRLFFLVGHPRVLSDLEVATLPRFMVVGISHPSRMGFEWSSLTSIGLLTALHHPWFLVQFRAGRQSATASYQHAPLRTRQDLGHTTPDEWRLCDCRCLIYGGDIKGWRAGEDCFGSYSGLSPGHILNSVKVPLTRCQPLSTSKAEDCLSPDPLESVPIFSDSSQLPGDLWPGLSYHPWWQKAAEAPGCPSSKGHPPNCLAGRPCRSDHKDLQGRRLPGDFRAMTSERMSWSVLRMRKFIMIFKIIHIIFDLYVDLLWSIADLYL